MEPWLLPTGAVAAWFAYKTANATLQLESEPLIMIEVEEHTADPKRVVQIEELDGKVFARAALPADTPSLFITLRHIGRSPAVNLVFRFIVTVPQTDHEDILFPIYVQRLLPQAPYVMGFCNQPHFMLTVDVAGVTAESAANVSKPKETLLARSDAMPLPLMWSPQATSSSDGPPLP